MPNNILEYVLSNSELVSYTGCIKKDNRTLDYPDAFITLVNEIAVIFPKLKFLTCRVYANVFNFARFGIRAF